MSPASPKTISNESLRQKLAERGSGCLDDAELLTIVLSEAEQPDSSALALSKEILRRASNSLRKLRHKPKCDVCLTKKAGFIKTTQIIAFFELAKRYGSEDDKNGVKLDNPESIFKRFRLKFLDYPQEVFTILLFDTQQRLMDSVEVSFGSLTASVISPREVFAPVISIRAVSIVMMHNHPSGDPTPSAKDREITDRIISGGELLGIPVLDHIIIGSKKFFSFRESGLIDSQSEISA